MQDREKKKTLEHSSARDEIWKGGIKELMSEEGTMDKWARELKERRKGNQKKMGEKLMKILVI